MIDLDDDYFYDVVIWK